MFAARKALLIVAKIFSNFRTVESLATFHTFIGRASRVLFRVHVKAHRYKSNSSVIWLALDIDSRGVWAPVEGASWANYGCPVLAVYLEFEAFICLIVRIRNPSILA